MEKRDILKIVDQSHYKELKRDIVQCLQSETQNIDVALLEKQNGILEYLNLSKIKIKEENMMWQESIYFAGKCLIQNGSIEQKYLDIIISQTMYYGPYMFITNNIMLAHAKPEDGVNKMDISMTIFKNPIFFKEGKKAEIIFILAAEDHEKHLKILNDILKIAENSEGIEKLLKSETNKAILQELENILAD